MSTAAHMEELVDEGLGGLVVEVAHQHRVLPKVVGRVAGAHLRVQGVQDAGEG